MTVLVFPQKKAIVKILKIPATDDREIAEMVKLQAARQTPLDANEIVMDYQVLGTTSEGYSRVLLAIVRKKELDDVLAQFEKNGLSADRIVLDSLVSLPLLRGPEPHEGFCLVMDFQGGWVTFGLFEGNSLLGTRSVPNPAVSEEIKKTIQAYRGFPMPGPELNVCLAGDEKEVATVQQEISQKWACSSKIVKPELGSAFFASTGHEFNLLPEETRDKKKQIVLRKKLRKLAGRSLVLVSGMGILLLLGFAMKHRELEKLNRESAAQSPEIKELRRMAGRMKAVRNQLNEPQSLLNVVAVLNKLVPERVSLRSLDFDHSHSLLLQGTCFTLSEAVHLVEVLQKSPLFTNVELRSSNIQRARDHEVVDFTVSCQFHANV